MADEQPRHANQKLIDMENEAHKLPELVEARRVRLHLALNAARIFTWEFDPATGDVFYSPNAADVLGFVPPPTVRQGAIHIHPDDRDAVREAYRRAARGDAELSVDYRIINPAIDALFWAHSHGQVVGADHGQPNLLVGTTQDITERKRTEVSLRASQEQYHALFDSIDQGFCVIELAFEDESTPVDYVFEQVNPAFERQTGIRDAVGRRMREIAPGHETRWFETYGRVATTGEPARFIRRAESLGDRWFDVYAFRLGGTNSRRVAVLFTDISERKRVEATLRRSEERLRRVIEIETVAIVFFRPDGTITDANDAFFRLTGYSRSDLERSPLQMDTLTPPEWLTRSHEALDELLMQGRNTPYEREYVRKDGSRWWGLFAATRLDDQEAVKFIIDITPTKRAEADRARLATIVASVHDSIIGTDVHGTITDWNRGASELYGYAAEEVVGRHVSLLTPNDRKAEISDFFTRVLAGESIPPTDTVRVHKDGRRIDVQLMLSPIADAVGKIVGVAGIARDTTVRKMQERAQQDFLAMASHDLRTPITVMRAQAQLMRRRKSYNDHSVEVILDQTHRMERLVADLQLTAQLETGQLELQRTRIDAIALAEEAADRARAQTGRHQIRIEAPTGPVIAWWDRVRMGQVLDNLVGNAIKYSPNGGSIVIGITSRDRETRLSVADEGTGVAPEVQGQLFERFYRADDAGIASGLGLGLYITRMLVSAHGGRIEIDSIPGEGSTFTVILPVIDQAGPEPDR